VHRCRSRPPHTRRRRISDTGIAGLTLGGGIGWLAGKYGLSCDNLLSMDMVTASGTFLTASASENADLFWGVHGGSGNFGVVTSFEYQLHPVGLLLAGLVLHPFDRAQETLRFYRDFARSLPDEVNTIGALLTSPEGTSVAAIAVCYNGDLSMGEQVLRPLREFGPPLVDGMRPRVCSEVQTLLDANTQCGHRNYIKSGFMQTISAAAIDSLIEPFATVPSPLTFPFFQQLEKAVSRVRPEATAFSHRDALCEWGCLSIWLDAAQDDRNIRWTRVLAEGIQPFTTGHAYVNQMGSEAVESAEAINAAYGAAYAAWWP
jgi:hypothetical protein